jgi:hypothetical protein
MPIGKKDTSEHVNIYGGTTASTGNLNSTIKERDYVDWKLAITVFALLPVNWMFYTN